MDNQKLNPCPMTSARSPSNKNHILKMSYYVKLSKCYAISVCSIMLNIFLAERNVIKEQGEKVHLMEDKISSKTEKAREPEDNKNAIKLTKL